MIKLIADKIKITGPQVDNGYKIILSVGEYQQKQVAELFTLPQQEAIQCEITKYKG